MKRFIVFVVVAFGLLGCGSALTSREICYGRCDGRADRVVCMQRCSGSREIIVGVEYASDDYEPPATTAGGDSVWECAGVKAYRAKHKDKLGAPLVLRREFAVSVSVRDMADVDADHAGTFLITYRDVSNAAPPLQRILGERSALWRGYPGDSDIHDLLSTIMRSYLHALSPPHEPVNIPGIGGTAAACWQRGTPQPDLSAWPAQGIYTPPSALTCRGAIYYRVRIGNDITPLAEHIEQRYGLAGPPSAAESELRRILFAHARADAVRIAGDSERLVLDTAGGTLDSTSIRCWHGSKPGAPVDWRGPTLW